MKSMTWEPTGVFIRGKIVKCFLPLEKYPNFSDDNLKNLYPGDEVYIFEITDDNKWARGYVETKPFPHDFTITSVKLDDTPTQNIAVLVFPIKCVQVLEQLPLSSEVNYNSKVPKTQYNESSDEDEKTFVLDISKPIKMCMPLLPIKTFNERNYLVEDIKDALELLTSRLFAFYSIGDFPLFYKLSLIYYNLVELRLKLLHGILTSSETKTAKGAVIQFLNKIPKVLSSRDELLSVLLNNLNKDNTDTSGYKALLTRDKLTGDLLSHSNSLPLQIAFNQVLCSLPLEYLINMHLEEPRFTLTPKFKKKFKKKLLYDVLIDIKSLQVSSTSHLPGYLGTVVYFYIRSGQERITETFKVRVKHAFSTSDIEERNAALFKNISFNGPISENVYLVAQIVEEIELCDNDINNKSQLVKIRKGVAVGVTDISKLLLDASSEHLFKMQLFGSYMSLTDEPMPYYADNIIKNGWSKTVDRVIEGLKTGIAFKLKFEGLVVCLKGFKHQRKVDINDDILTLIPIIHPICSDPLIEEYECIYLKIESIVLLENSNKNDLLTIKVSSPGSDLVFSNGNKNYKRVWQFLTVGPNEPIGEIVRINGLSLKNVKKNDCFLFSFYINGRLTAEGRFLYKPRNTISSMDNNSNLIKLNSLEHDSTIANINISTDYVGKAFNADINVNNILQYEEHFKNGNIGIQQLSAWLIAFHQLGLRQLVTYFIDLLRALFSIVDISTKQPLSESQQKLKNFTFSAIVYMLDTVFGGNDNYVYLIEMFIQENIYMPPIGTFIMNNISNILLQAEKNWTSTSIRICRVISILMSFAIKSMDSASDLVEYFKALENLSVSGSYFLSLKPDFYIDSQVQIINTLDNILKYNIHIDDIEALRFIVRFIDSIGSKGLGIDDVLYITNKVYVSNRNAKTENAHRIIIGKLLLIHRLFYTRVVNGEVARKILLSKAIKWAMEALNGRTDIDASRLACSILNCVCTLLSRIIVEENNKEEVQLCFSLSKLLPSISRAIIKYERYTRENGFYKPKTNFGLLFPSSYPFTEVPVDPLIKEEVLVEIQVELSVIFCFIARIGKEVSRDSGYQDILKTEDVTSFFDTSEFLVDEFGSKDLTDLIFGINIIRRGKFMPKSKWLSLYSILIEGCVASLGLLKPLLHSSFIPSFGSQKKFEIVIWGNYLKCLLQLGVTLPVSIEYLSKVPNKACYQITGKIQEKIAYMVYESWDLLAKEANDDIFTEFNISRLGGYQMKFINTQYCILPDLMLFALQKNSECQAVAVKILWSIIVAYFLEKRTIIDVERQCFLGFRDIYYNNVYKPNAFEQQKFINRLKHTFRLGCECEAVEEFDKFIKSTEGYLKALNEYICIPIDSEFDEDRMLHELKINVYLKNVNKPELFNSLINTIYEKNINKKDYTQAALNMELLASTYSWDLNIILPASLKPKFHRQTSFERKESLFNIIAKNFIKGNNLERAADTYNELLDSYRLNTYDLKRFANIHAKLANLYLCLATSDNLNSSYFKVSYIGGGFPPSVNGKTEIREGAPFEHVKSVENRLLKLHPGAQVITDHLEAQKLIQRPQIGKYLHVYAVEPLTENSGSLINAAHGIRKYVRNKDLRFFSLIRKIPGASSVYDLWTEEVTYETSLRFPTVLNKSEVKNIKVVKLSPLDNAIRTIVKKYNDLAQIEIMLINAFKEKNEYSSLLKDLRVTLSGTIDSPVNGGVGQYRKFIYDDKYESDQHLASQRLLKDSFDELCKILNRCLKIHSKLVTPDMKEFHDTLLGLYKDNFQEEIEKLQISSDHASSYNQSHYQSSISSQVSQVDIEKMLTKSETDASSFRSNLSVTSLPSQKLSIRMNKLLNWKKLRNQD